MPRKRKTRYCYICLNPISTGGLTLNSVSPWVETYSFCFGVAMAIDETPKNMCGICRDKLSEFSNFKKMALRSNNLWNCSMKSNNKKVLDNSNEIKDESEDIELDESNDNQDYDDDTEPPEDTKEVLLIKTEVGNVNNTTRDDLINHSQSTYYKSKSILDNEISDEEHYLVCVKEDEDLDEENTSNTVLDNEQDSNYEPDEMSSNSFTKKERVSRKKACYENKYIHKKKPNAPSNDCGLCEATFSDVTTLRKHLTKHGNKNDLCCKMCDFSGQDFADMVSHRIVHLSKDNKILKCHLCDKRFQNPLRLQFHYRSVHLNEKGGRCRKCNKSFIDLKGWMNHERLHVEARYICDICGRRVLFRHEMIQHLKTHYKPVEHICEICGRVFTKTSNLKAHLATHVTSKVKCTHCNKIYKNEISLTSHMRDVNSEKPYQCEFCSNSFRTHSRLKRHYIWHMDVRNFVCGVCGLAYKTNHYLKIHMLKHTGEWPHKCDQCEGKFKTHTELKIHSAVHTGVRRNKCAHCTRSYNGKKDLLQHIIKHHSGVIRKSKDDLAPTV